MIFEVFEAFYYSLGPGQRLYGFQGSKEEEKTTLLKEPEVLTHA